MRKFLNRVLKSKSGATAIEYGLIAALVAVALVGAVRSLGTSVSGVFGDVSTTLDAVDPAAAS